MSLDLPALEILALIVTIALAGLAAVRLNRPHARIGDRARAVVRESGGMSRPNIDEAPPGLTEQLTRNLAELGNRLPLFNHKQRQQILDLLRGAGLRHHRALPIFIATKVSCGGLGILGGVFALRSMGEVSGLITAFVLLACLQVGLMAPEALLHQRVKARRKAIHRSLPDALDLMVICTNAGYSLAAAIKRVAAEMRQLCPALSDEFDLTAHDVQISADTVTALRGLADRTKVESLRSVVVTLIQAQQFGTPITQSLKTLAKTERHTRMLMLEEKGAKLATKLTLPMMLLILPAVILIAGAPAMMQLMESLQ